MIRRATIEDREFLNSVWLHPKIYPYIMDDLTPKINSVDWDFLLANETVYFLVAEGVGAFLFHPRNSITFEVHSAVLPEHRGKKGGGLKAMQEARDWMFQNSPCLKIETHVPKNNRLAYAAAVKIGMKPEGTKEASFLSKGRLLDEYSFGIRKEM